MAVADDTKTCNTCVHFRALPGWPGASGGVGTCREDKGRYVDPDSPACDKYDEYVTDGWGEGSG
jgi:hypothetical protein